MTTAVRDRRLTLAQTIRALLRQTQYELQTSFAYSGAYYLTALTTVVSYAVLFLVWSFVLARRETVGGLAPRAMAAYLVIATWISLTLFLRFEAIISERIRSGLIAVDLLKPVGFHASQFARAVGHALFQATLASLLLAGGFAALGRDLLPVDPGALAGFAASVVLAFLIQFSLGFLFIQGAFVSMRNYGLIQARLMLHFSLSGLSAPLTAFPPALRTVADWLPFRHVIYTPASIWLGLTPAAAVPAVLLEQALWAAGLFLAGRWVFAYALRHLTIQGG